MRWALLALLLTGCASQQLVDLRAFSVADLRAAQDMAVERGDLAASTCFPVLIKHIQAAQMAQPSLHGALSAFETIRLVVRPPAVRNPEIHVACAALVADTLVDVGKFDLAVAKAYAAAPSAIPDALRQAKIVVELLRALGRP